MTILTPSPDSIESVQAPQSAAPLNNKPLARPSIAELRLDQSFDVMANAEDVAAVASLQRPEDGLFFRVHPDWRLSCYFLKVGCGRDTTLCVVDPGLVAALEDEAKLYTCVPYLDREGNLYFWPLRSPNNKNDMWAHSAFSVAELARTRWTRRLSANNQYRAKLLPPETPAPDWSAYDLNESFLSAISESFIDSINHPSVVGLGVAA